jgi:hypothetical protein
MTGRRRHATLDYSGLFMKACIRYDFRYFEMGSLVGPRDEQAVTAVDDGPGDAGDLIGGLPLPEHNLRKTLSDGAVVVDAREAKVFKGLPLDTGQVPRPAFGVGRIQATVAHRVEQRAQRVERPNRRWRMLGHGCAFDSARSPYLELRVVPSRRSLIL